MERPDLDALGQKYASYTEVGKAIAYARHLERNNDAWLSRHTEIAEQKNARIAELEAALEPIPGKIENWLPETAKTLARVLRKGAQT